MNGLDLVRITLEQREASLKDDLTRVADAVESLGSDVKSKHEKYSAQSFLDGVASDLESLLREVHRLQACERSARELREAYDFMNSQC